MSTRSLSSIATVVLTVALITIALFIYQLIMFFVALFAPALVAPVVAAQGGSVDTTWHAPDKTWVNDLERVLNDEGTNGFWFEGSKLPEGVEYGTYNWCNMPHVRREEYPRVDESEWELSYVEVIHRHHKRTPYASNTFPRESYDWQCSDQGLFYYGQPLDPVSHPAVPVYWNVSKSSINPFAQTGFNGSCQFPQITRGGLDDSWQHGRDLWGVYGELLNFLPADDYASDDSRLTFRVTANVITSQVAGMVSQGLLSVPPNTPFPLLRAPDGTDSLEPSYTCPASTSLLASFGPGSSDPAWRKHLDASADLFASLDTISDIPASDDAWHRSWDHYFDNLSARQCHAKPLPCHLHDASRCVSQELADKVYRLGQYEYSYLYRDAPLSLAASAPAFGLWIAELVLHIRAHVAGESAVRYRHNVAHDGSVSRLLSVLQVAEMVWPGMGAEVVFEVYKRRSGEGRWALRILWGGQVLRSSHPALGSVDMVDLDVFLGYVDGLVGERAGKVVGLCEGS